MATGVFEDADGNKVWVEKRRLMLKYAVAPSSGKQLRCIGSLQLGIWKKNVPGEWEMRKWGHWAISRLPLVEYKRLGYNIIQFSGQKSDGSWLKGFVHPYTLLQNPIREFSKTGNDKQHMLRMEDICRSPEQAKERARAIKARIEAEAQAARETPANTAEPAQKGLFNGDSEE